MHHACSQLCVWCTSPSFCLPICMVGAGLKLLWEVQKAGPGVSEVINKHELLSFGRGTTLHVSCLSILLKAFCFSICRLPRSYSSPCTPCLLARAPGPQALSATDCFSRQRTGQGRAGEASAHQARGPMEGLVFCQ